MSSVNKPKYLNQCYFSKCLCQEKDPDDSETITKRELNKVVPVLSGHIHHLPLLTFW